jgi:SNF2 family DNA or RNA helicase
MHLVSHDKLSRYLKANASQTILSRATQIVRYGKFSLALLDEDNGGRATFRVRSEQYSNIHYEVEIRNFLGKDPMTTSCTCPSSIGNICKHEAAMIMYLDKHEIMAAPVVLLPMQDNVVYLPDLSDEYIRVNTADFTWKNRVNLRSVHIHTALKGVVKASMEQGGQIFNIEFSQLEAGKIHSSCTCAEQLPEALCAHKVAALLALREQYGIKAFSVMRDWSEEKNRMLSDYGFSLDDKLDGKFDFRINDNGELEMKVLDPSLQSPVILGRWWQNRQNQQQTEGRQFQVISPPELPEESERLIVYALTRQPEGQIPDLVLAPLTARLQPDRDKLSGIGKFETLFATYGDKAEVPVISENDSRLINLSKNSFSSNALMAAIRRAGAPMPRWQYGPLPEADLSDDARRAALLYLGEMWDRSLPLLAEKYVVVSPNGQHHANQMEHVRVQTQPVKPVFRLYEEDGFAVFETLVNIEGLDVPVDQCRFLGYWFLQQEDTLLKIADFLDAETLHHFGPAGKIKVKISYLNRLMTDLVLPLSEHYQVDLDIDAAIEYRYLHFKEPRIYLREDERHLLFVPQFAYQRAADDPEVLELPSDGKNARISYENERVTVWNRDLHAEKAFWQLLLDSHPQFAQQNNQGFLYLPFDAVLRGQWLFGFFENMKQRNIPVFGFNTLKKFRYNPNKPVFKMQASSGIDWFDLRVEIHFGDQQVGLAEIKKAVLNKQNYIQLNDGTLGIIPEEWLTQYGSLFKFGQAKGDTLQLSKLHFSIIDELYSQLDDEKIFQEVQDKKRKLLHFKEIRDVQLPRNTRAELRDYQREGYKWLHFLEEFGWGGCLADDMGLGKTVQILTFLQHIKELAPDSTHLIVMPTTLIFNWQAEVEKFAPNLRIFVHRGVARERHLDFFRQYDLILTTYGTLRSDIEQFSQFPFNYVVLDESQAIKNPDSKIAKAVKLLRARNRLVMTGTPVENNTFDLYSQMDFVNPGLLGGPDFFRSEYATPIDKYRDEDKARELRRIIYPFILKRTKEEVAKDLPDKTETVLFCEMGKKQRRVYETFRDLYRQKILEKMAADGKDKAAFLILEALLKLRQICDSPALLSDEVDYGEESAKLEEIIREIEENAGHHKILIFSQFLKMLDLVRNHLEQAGIPYEYLDGSTQDRAARVHNFQENASCRVFLMSLKAGGVGINLTEADYVYLVDPWWNPAVEQQAIDRTHRIGQTKKVFAYKMICKDTVEEKILQLQEKKKEIAKDLISTEQGFIKKLSQEDIVALFS